MRRAYNMLTYDEYNVLNKVARKTRMDCWFVLKQDARGVDYVYDLEERKRMCLKTGVSLLADGIDCQENFDNCCLDGDEKWTLAQLFIKLNISLNESVSWNHN